MWAAIILTLATMLVAVPIMCFVETIIHDKVFTKKEARIFSLLSGASMLSGAVTLVILFSISIKTDIKDFNLYATKYREKIIYHAELPNGDTADFRAGVHYDAEKDKVVQKTLLDSTTYDLYLTHDTWTKLNEELMLKTEVLTITADRDT